MVGLEEVVGLGLGEVVGLEEVVGLGLEEVVGLGLGEVVGLGLGEVVGLGLEEVVGLGEVVGLEGGGRVRGRVAVVTVSKCPSHRLFPPALKLSSSCSCPS